VGDFLRRNKRALPVRHVEGEAETRGSHVEGEYRHERTSNQPRVVNRAAFADLRGGRQLDQLLQLESNRDEGFQILPPRDHLQGQVLRRKEHVLPLRQL